MSTLFNTTVKALAVLSSLSLLSSCALQEKGPYLDPFAAINPAHKFNPLAPASPLASAVVTQWEKDFAKPGFLEANPYWHSRQGRDELIYRLILMSDYRFSRYEADLVAGKATRDSFIDLTVLGLTSAATLLTPGQVTRVLSAISGGLIGSRATIEKNFYQNQAQPVLLRKMKVLRQQKLFAISHRLRKYDINVYPTERALIDVLDYYNRGTMLSALQEISNDTAAQEIEITGGKVQRPTVTGTIEDLPASRFPKRDAPIEDLPPARHNTKIEDLPAARRSEEIADLPAARKKPAATPAPQPDGGTLGGSPSRGTEPVIESLPPARPVIDSLPPSRNKPPK